MANQKTSFLPTIGIETHVQLNTRTKLFSAVSNDARGADPNTLISHIDLGMPGALPVLNQEALNKAMLVAFAFNTTPQKFSYFERKHYFYPDLPKGYQITQLTHPIIVGGYVEIDIDDEKKKIRLNRVQIEEDAGKSTHPAGKDYSLVDLNRAGTPLLEIVSEPDLHSSVEAKAYAKEIYLIMRYLNVSDADMYHGNMRFDVNVSLSTNKTTLGTRTETKNLNSFRSVEKAIDYEIKRQTDLLSKGHTITQETRGWDDAKQKTFSQRTKEEAHDYRYFPEPDIPPVELNDEEIARIKKTLPLLPKDYRMLFEELKLGTAATTTLVASPSNATLVKTVLEMGNLAHGKRVANWIVNTISKSSEDEISDDVGKTDPGSAIELSKLVEADKLSSTTAKEIWIEMSKHGGEPLEIAEAKNLLQVSDSTELEQLVVNTIADNPQAAADVKNGESKAVGYLVGQVMKASSGKANPSLVQKLIKTTIEAS